MIPLIIYEVGKERQVMGMVSSLNGETVCSSRTAVCFEIRMVKRELKKKLKVILQFQVIPFSYWVS